MLEYCIHAWFIMCECIIIVNIFSSVIPDKHSVLQYVTREHSGLCGNYFFCKVEQQNKVDETVGRPNFLQALTSWVRKLNEGHVEITEDDNNTCPRETSLVLSQSWTNCMLIALSIF